MGACCWHLVRVLGFAITFCIIESFQRPGKMARRHELMMEEIGVVKEQFFGNATAIVAASRQALSSTVPADSVTDLMLGWVKEIEEAAKDEVKAMEEEEEKYSGKAELVMLKSNFSRNMEGLLSTSEEELEEVGVPTANATKMLYSWVEFAVQKGDPYSFDWEAVGNVKESFFKHMDTLIHDAKHHLADSYVSKEKIAERLASLIRSAQTVPQAGEDQGENVLLFGAIRSGAHGIAVDTEKGLQEAGYDEKAAREEVRGWLEYIAGKDGEDEDEEERYVAMDEKKAWKEEAEKEEAMEKKLLAKLAAQKKDVLIGLKNGAVDCDHIPGCREKVNGMLEGAHRKYDASTGLLLQEARKVFEDAGVDKERADAIMLSWVKSSGAPDKGWDKQTCGCESHWGKIATVKSNFLMRHQELKRRFEFYMVKVGVPKENATSTVVTWADGMDLSMAHAASVMMVV